MSECTQEVTSAKNQYLAAHLLEQAEVLFHRGRFIFGALLEQMAAVPAGDKGQAVTLEHRCQGLRIARKLAAEFDACITCRCSLGQTGLQTDVTTDARQVIVTPSDGIDADRNIHQQLLPLANFLAIPL